MYKFHNSLLHNIGVIAICYTYFLCPEHNSDIVRYINLQPFSGGASIGVTISLVYLLHSA